MLKDKTSSFLEGKRLIYRAKSKRQAMNVCESFSFHCNLGPTQQQRFLDQQGALI